MKALWASLHHKNFHRILPKTFPFQSLKIIFKKNNFFIFYNTLIFRGLTQNYYYYKKSEKIYCVCVRVYVIYIKKNNNNNFIIKD